MEKPDLQKILTETWDNKWINDNHPEEEKQKFRHFIRRPDSHLFTRLAMEEYGKQMFNYALELAAENAEVKEERYFVLSLGDDDRDWDSTYMVDKESILKLKIP